MSDSPSPTRLSQLDFIRGISILLVLLWHSPVDSPNSLFRSIVLWPEKFGWAGVDFFFVLSGFLVGGLLISEVQRTGKIDAKRFILRRGFKIWPQYYVYLAVAALERVRTHSYDELHRMWSNLFHVQNYFGTPLNHTWSLAVEEHFYLGLVVLIAWLAARNTKPRGYLIALGAVIGFFTLLRCVLVLNSGGKFDFAHWQTHCRLDGLCIGVLLTAVYRLERPWFDRLAAQRVWLGLAFIAGIVWLYNIPLRSYPMTTIGFTFNSLTACSLIILLLSAKPGEGAVGRIIQSAPYRWVAWIGLYSYGAYLWQFAGGRPAAKLFLKFAGDPTKSLPVYFIGLAIWIAGAVLCGALTTKLVEWPALKLRDRLMPSQERAI